MIQRPWQSLGWAALVVMRPVDVTHPQGHGLEYRLQHPDGMPAYWRDGTQVLVGRLPFLTGADFATVAANRSKNPNTPGAYDIVLTHTPIGRAKFKAVA